jgi:hypothetical protein
MFARPGRIRAYCSVSGGLDALRDAGGVSDVELFDARRTSGTVDKEEAMIGRNGPVGGGEDYDDEKSETSSSRRRREEEEEEEEKAAVAAEKMLERRELHALLNREDSAYGYTASNTNQNRNTSQNRRNSNTREEEGPTTPPNRWESEQPPPRVGAKRGAVPHSRSMPEFGEAKLWARRNRKQPQRLDVRLQCVQLGVIESPSSYV